MDINWSGLGLGEEPAFSLAALEPPDQHANEPPDQHALALITAQEEDVHMEDFVHDYFSVERFKKAYKRIIEPLPDRTQWPDVDLPFVVRAPLGKRGKGRQKKLRMKSCLEGGNSKGKKAAAERGKETDKEADKEAMEVEAAKQTEKGKKQMIRGKRKCKRCGELGHGETSNKCPLNGTKKRKRKPRKNTTKYGENAKVPTSRKRAKKGKTVQEEEGAAAVIVCEDGAAAAVQEGEGPADVQERERGLLFHYLCRAQLSLQWNQLYKIAQSGLPGG